MRYLTGRVYETFGRTVKYHADYGTSACAVRFIYISMMERRKVQGHTVVLSSSTRR